MRDFPAGADRLVADAIGIRAVVVNGTVIREDGRDAVDPTAPLPGRVLRGGRRRDAIPIISADSHITEPPNTYIDYIDPRGATRAPRMEHVDESSATSSSIDGMKQADRRSGSSRRPASRPRRSACTGVRFEELHRGGWDPDARLADQDRDGVAAEVIYPTVGMVLCNHPDFDYKKACFDAYNRWIAEYCAAHPDAAARLRPDRDALARGGHRATSRRSRRSACAA